jgi:hypothetical protein
MLLGQGAEEFLGTQGDQWDTQWDMSLALGGACASLILLGRWHDRQLATLPWATDEAEYSVPTQTHEPPPDTRPGAY